jgi:hypothetical protein
LHTLRPALNRTQITSTLLSPSQLLRQACLLLEPEPRRPRPANGPVPPQRQHRQAIPKTTLTSVMLSLSHSLTQTIDHIQELDHEHLAKLPPEHTTNPD